MKHRNTMLDISFLVIGSDPIISTILEETKAVDTWSPMTIIRKSTTTRKAETPPTIARSLEMGWASMLKVEGRNTVMQKMAMNTLVKILLISELTSAFLTRRFIPV
jgi:hypothetical protein